MLRPFLSAKFVVSLNQTSSNKIMAEQNNSHAEQGQKLSLGVMCLCCFYVLGADHVLLDAVKLVGELNQGFMLVAAWTADGTLFVGNDMVLQARTQQEPFGPIRPVCFVTG